jgi:hypothetical protein
MRVLAVCCALVLANAIEIAKHNDRIFILDSEIWDDAIEEYNPMVVKFYAPWYNMLSC